MHSRRQQLRFCLDTQNGADRGGIVDKGRQPEIILKTDERDSRLEPRRDGKLVAESTGWDEKRVYFEGDKLEIAMWSAAAGC